MKKEYRELKNLIEKSKNILILTHKGPDFDGFSSGLILKKYIDTYYPKKAVTFKSRQYPTQNIPYMHELQITQAINPGEEDLVIIVDTAGWDMCITSEDTIQITKAKIAIIDHHSTKPMDAQVVVNDNMSSTTEQVLDFCIQTKGKKYNISQEISTLGQIGIVFDTGGFLYDNTKPETFELMAKLRRIYELDLEDFEYKSSKFPTEALLPLKIYIHNIHIIGDMAFTYLTKADIQNYKLTKIGVNAAQGFVRDNIIRYMQGIHWGFVVKPSFTIENEWRVSFRSTKGYQEVATIAEALDGGGHQYSSATRIKALDGDQASKIVLDTINKVLQNKPTPLPVSPTL